MDGESEFGALLQVRAKPGQRDELVRMFRNYVNTLDGEPGTQLFIVAADANDEDTLWVWEQFKDAGAVRAHFEHDFFRALQLELADLLDAPIAIRPLSPVIHRINPGVAAE